MTDVGLYCSGAHIVRKAGVNANASGASLTWTDQFVQEAESFINCSTRYNWGDNYSTLNTDVKYILQEAASDLAAMYVINYDMTDFNSRAEAELMMTVLYQRAIDCIEMLKDIKTQTFMTGA